jgi:hypothetical protein
LLVVDRCFGVKVLGTPLTFVHFSSLSHGIVFLTTFRTMCHLSLGVWTNTLFVLFVCFYFFFLSIYKFFFAMLLIEHDLLHNCRLHIIGMFNLFEHCISLEILVFDSCVGL